MAGNLVKKAFDPYSNPKRLAKIGRDVTRRLDANPAVDRIEVTGAQIYVVQDFLDDADCQMLIDRMENNAVPSTLYEGIATENYRTSYSCFLSIEDNKVEQVEERMAQLIGIPNAQAETMQGQRYAVGQEFKPHHDYFHASEEYWQLERKKGGQRCWTAIIYLNEPEAGGETEFPRLSIGINPRKGMMLVWNNMNADGTPNNDTLHWGKPVLSGSKYIITKWYRLNDWLTINYPQYRKRNA